MQKTGTVKVVASTGGIRLFGEADDIWYNPADKVVPEGLDYLKSLSKKKVIITLNDKGKYTKIDEDTGNNREIPNYPANEQKSAPQQAKTGQVDRETSIVRQTCLKVAGEVAKSNMFPMPPEGYKEIRHLAADVLTLAEEFEEWVNRK